MAEGNLYDIGGVVVRMVLEDSDVGHKVEEAKTKIGSIKGAATLAVTAIASVVTAATAAITTAIGIAIHHADEINKISQKLGTSVEAITRLDYAAQLSDVSMESLETSIGRLNKNLNDVANGGGKDVKSLLENLGVTITDSNGHLKDSTEVLSDIAGAFERIPDGTQKSAAAIQLFGRAGADLIPLLNQGKAGLKELADESDRVGFTLDTKTARAAEAFNDSLTKLRLAAGGAANRLMVDLLPGIQTLTETIESPAFINAVSAIGTATIGVINVIAELAKGASAAVNDLWNALNRKAGDSAAGSSVDGIKQQIADWKKVIADNTDGFGGINMGMTNTVMRARNNIEALNKELAARAKGATTLEGGAFKSGWGSTGLGDQPKDKPAGDGLPGFNLPTGPSADDQKTKLTALEDSLNTEAEAEQDSFATRMKQLEDFHAQGLIDDQEFADDRERLFTQHWDKMKQINESGLTDLAKFSAMSWEDQAKTIFSQLESITSGVKDQNDILFNINKTAAVANAIINAYEGVSKALSSYPPPLSFIMAGVQAAAGFAQVSAILATQRNSTSAAPVGTSGSADAAAASSAGQGVESTPSRRLYVQGIDPSAIFTGAMVSDLAKMLVGYQKDGGQVIIE